MAYVKRIATGVMIILWIVITGALTWPLAAVIDPYAYEGGSDASIIFGFVIAAIAATVICRLVFPVEYETTSRESIAKDS